MQSRRDQKKSNHLAFMTYTLKLRMKMYNGYNRNKQAFVERAGGVYNMYLYLRFRDLGRVIIVMCVMYDCTVDMIDKM